MATPLASAFAAIAHARHSRPSFDAARLIDAATLRSLVALTARAPSGFNLQPYAIVLVDDARVRARLAGAMLGAGNAERVARAPLTAVFAADLDAMASVREVQDMEARAGHKPAAYLRSLPTSAAAFASSQQGGCGGTAASALGAAAAASLGALTGVPLPPLGVPGIAWAYKQTGLAAMMYMLAATSLGLGTHPMEGLDPARAAQAVGLSATRFSVALVLATGWPAAEAAAAPAPPPSPRRMGVFRLNRASQPFPLE